MPPVTDEPKFMHETEEMPSELERIALRSSLPVMPELPAFPSFDVGRELPRSSFTDLAPKAEAPPKPVEPKTVEPPKNRVVEPAAGPAEPKQLDVAYFPTRAMLPELTVFTLVSAGWIMVIMPLLPSFLQSWEVYASAPGAFGLFTFVRWLFRVISGGYKLTNRQLLRVNAGPIPDPEPIDLATITAVKVDCTISEMCLAVGRLRITCERDQHPEIVLGPVSFPRRRAMILEEAIELAREGSVVGSRVAA